MSAEAVRWVRSTTWEPSFFGLPQEVPWPAEADPAAANVEPFDMDLMLDAIEALGSEATEPWKGFLAAAELHQRLAEALEHRETEDALATLDEIEKRHPGSAFALFHRAQIARVDGGEEEAIELYQAAAAKAPRVAPIWDSLGSLLTLRGEKAKAIAAFRQALAVAPRDHVALEGLTALRELIKLKSADPQDVAGFRYVDVPTFRQMALRQVQGMTSAEELMKYADQLLRDGSAPGAVVAAVERASQLAPGEPRILLGLSTAYQANQQLPEARATLERLTLAFPQEPAGFLQLASVCHALGDVAAESAALDQALALDLNLQPALAAKFQLMPGEHDPKVEDALASFGAVRSSWMAHLLAGVISRERGDHAATLRHAQHAMELNPNSEEVLIAYASALGDLKELPLLTKVIKPATESGQYSKRLDWTYANVLRQLHMTADAVAVLRKTSKNASPDFKQMAERTIDAWIGLVTGCGVRLEVHQAGFLPRPIVIALADGDGGIILEGGAKLPAEARFPWRASGDKAAVSLQQGETGIGAGPLELGVFLARGVKPDGGESTNVECHLAVQPDGAIHFRATQKGHKLHVGWTNYPGA